MLFSENNIISARDSFRAQFRNKTRLLKLKLSEIDSLFSDVFFHKDYGAAIAESRVNNLCSMPSVLELTSKAKIKGIDISHDVAETILFEVLKPIFTVVEPFLIGLCGSNKYHNAKWSLQSNIYEDTDIIALYLTSEKIQNKSALVMCGYKYAHSALDSVTCDLYCTLYNHYLQSATEESIPLQNPTQFHPDHSSYFSIFNSIKVQMELSKQFLNIFYEEAESLYDISMRNKGHQLSLTNFLEELSDQISINELSNLVADCCAEAFTAVAERFQLWRTSSFENSIYSEYFVNQMVLGFITPKRFSYLFEQDLFDNKKQAALKFNDYVKELIKESAKKSRSGLLTPLD